MLVFLHPCQIFRVLLHLYEGLALEPAEVHLLQPVHRNELCPGKEHPRRLGGALQRGDIDHLRCKICLPQLGDARGGKGDVPLALISFLRVVLRLAVTQQIMSIIVLLFGLFCTIIAYFAVIFQPCSCNSSAFQIY